MAKKSRLPIVITSLTTIAGFSLAAYYRFKQEEVDQNALVLTPSPVQMAQIEAGTHILILRMSEGHKFYEIVEASVGKDPIVRTPKDSE